MKNKFLALAALSVMFFACDKEDEPDEPTRTQTITQASWKLDVAGIDQDKDGDIDVTITSQIPSCMADNTLTLASNGSGTVDEGTVKCNASDPQTSPVTWSFTNNETTLNMNSSFVGMGGQSKILALTTTSLSLSKDSTLPFFGNVAVIVNLKH
jgi:hypothetical protein